MRLRVSSELKHARSSFADIPCDSFARLPIWAIVVIAYWPEG
jgi:hypothetical protein